MTISTRRSLLSFLLSVIVLLCLEHGLSAQGPDLTEVDERMKSIDLMLTSANLAAKKDWRGAMRYMNLAIARDASWPHLLANEYNARADIWAEIGNYRNALLDYERATKLNPAEAFHVYSDKARTRAKFHDLDKALADAEKARLFAVHSNTRRGSLCS
ncbi:MAG: tetratricopeptide repeat protein [Acidobacteriota bacterium]